MTVFVAFCKKIKREIAFQKGRGKKRINLNSGFAVMFLCCLLLYRKKSLPIRYSNANATDDRVLFLLVCPTLGLDLEQCSLFMLTALLFPGDQQVKSDLSWGSDIASDKKTSPIFTQEDQLLLFAFWSWRGNGAPCLRAMPNPDAVTL